MEEDEEIARLEAMLADDSNTRVITSSTAVAPLPVTVDVTPVVVETIKVVEKPVAKKETELQKRKRIVQEIAEDIHPESWDLQEIDSGADFPLSSAKYLLIIHFPAITLQNSRSNTHKLKDLYVALPFDSRMNHLRGWWGIRSTLSYSEFKSNYAHSHLSSSTVLRDLNSTKMCRFTEFCLGGGTITYNTVNGLAASSWNPKELENSLLIMHSYVAWESIEGGPFKSMSNIRLGGNTAVASPSVNDCKQLWALFIATPTPIQLEIDKLMNIPKLKVTNVEEIEKALLPCTTYKQIKTEQGRYENIGNSSSQSTQSAIDTFNERQTPLFTFKGEGVKGKILPIVSKEEPKEDNLVIHNVLSSYIIDQATQAANIYYLKIKK